MKLWNEQKVFFWNSEDHDWYSLGMPYFSSSHNNTIYSPGIFPGTCWCGHMHQTDVSKQRKCVKTSESVSIANPSFLGFVLPDKCNKLMLRGSLYSASFWFFMVTNGNNFVRVTKIKKVPGRWKRKLNSFSDGKKICMDMAFSHLESV